MSGPALPAVARTLAGVAACRAGWIALGRDAGAGEASARVYPRLEFLIEALAADAVLVVDMPIGLPDTIDGPGRDAEKAVRPLLGERQSSVFSTPARAAVEIASGPHADPLQRREALAAAGEAARRHSRPPRGIAIQSFARFPRILELDRMLRARPALAGSVFESHPEVAYWALNGGTAMACPRTVRNVVDPAGMEERRRLLLEHGLSRTLLYSPAPGGATQDELLSAAAMLAVANRVAAGLARPFPDPPGRDRHGLPIAIWA